MNQKAERPTLQGQRFRTRKRDEKEKFNPTGFRDTILTNFQTLNGGLCLKPEADIDAVIKCLLSDTKIDYRIYGEQLFDIIIAGGILAPGGSIVTDSDSSKQYKTDICLFKAAGDSGDIQTIKNFANIFVRLIQRFGYLEKTLEEEFKKIIVFLKGFEPDDRIKLAKLAAVLISLGILSPVVFVAGIQDHLVKDGIILDFVIQCLQTYIAEKDPNTVWVSLRRSGVDNRLLDFLPPNKRSTETIIQIFQNNGLSPLVSFIKTKESEAKKIELQKKISALVKNKASSKDVIELVQNSTKEHSLDESEIVVLIWKTLMSVVEWNKKEELVAEQAMRHLKTYAPLMEAFTKTAKAQLALLIRIQEFCYENMNFLKVFHKILVLLYKADVLTEDVIIEWYKRGHSNKGKSVFLDQAKPFIDWLTSAEEESDDE